MKKRLIKQILYVLLILGSILLASHLEYKEIQDDQQAQKDCRMQDVTE